MEEMVFIDPPKMKATPFTTSEEMEALEKASGQIAALIEVGMSYPQIRDILQNKPSATTE